MLVSLLTSDANNYRQHKVDWNKCQPKAQPDRLPQLWQSNVRRSVGRDINNSTDVLKSFRIEKEHMKC